MIKRQKVYNKYNKHCAYCGKKIESMRDMQIDHIRPKREWVEALAEGENIDDISNLNPACRRCNHYKRSLDIEGFREYIKTLHERIEKQYINKVGLDYGIISVKPFDGEFYFEKMRRDKNGI